MLGTHFVEFVVSIQTQICVAVEALEGKPPREDQWEREGGGGGRPRVLQEGRVFEKAGANVSIVHGKLPVEAARAMGGGQELGEESRNFWASGVSCVIHPHNPFVPTVHCNYRYFERLDDDGNVRAWWFGGGADLTPSYLFDDDARHFHRLHEEACSAHNADYYPRFKKWCDDYFFIKHRGEARGIGGIFFDNLNEGTPESLFDFVQACGNAFVPAYFPIAERRLDHPYEESHKRWQQLRRGRYVEFNLVYDRGTTFGLKTGGRTESILMSLPLTARWEYDVGPEPDSPEYELTEALKSPRDWVVSV